MKHGNIIDRINRIHSNIMGNRYLISHEFDPRLIHDLQLFIDEDCGNMWIIAKKVNGPIEPLLLHQFESVGKRVELMHKLKNATPGTIIEHDDLEKCRNHIGFTKKNGLLPAFFGKSQSGKGYNVYKGSTVHLALDDVQICHKAIFATLLEMHEKEKLLNEEQKVPFPYQIYYSKYF
jgi:hypothetical protein